MDKPGDKGFIQCLVPRAAQEVMPRVLPEWDGDTGARWAFLHRHLGSAGEKGLASEWACSPEVPSGLGEVTCNVAVTLRYDAN